jgi:pantoate--beta-alanine ligase
VTHGAEMRRLVLAARARGERVGLVPTMGALHDGHVSLVAAAKANCDLAVATIFVNPAQFGPAEDFTRYPRSLDADLAKLAAAGADLVFTPAVEEIYPPGFSTHVEPPAVAEPLEGRIRPGHFRGVCTVVLKLFHLAPADAAFFGQKDYQQCLVIRRMTEDLNVPIEIRVEPTVREADGLAMSSRNSYLSADERRRAAAVSRGLRAAAGAFQKGERRAAALRDLVARELQLAGIDQVDYIAIANRQTLDEPEHAGDESVALVAVRVGTTRLIDNMELG